MSSDLGSSLENASVAPQSPLDMSRVWNGAHKRTRVTRVVAVVGIMAVAVASFGIYQGVSDGSQGNGFRIAPATSISPSPEPSCFFSEDAGVGEPGVEMTVRVCPSEIVHVDDEDDVSVSVPQGWNVAEENLTPNLDDPREILSLGTSPLIPGGRCARLPTNTLDAMGPRDAFFSIQERRTSSTNEPRPASFRNKLQDIYLNFDACTDVSDFRIFWDGFNDEGRDFYLFAALGERASRARVDDFWNAIESLNFAPTSAIQEDVKPSAGCAEIIETADGDRDLDNVQIVIEQGDCPDGQFLIPPSPQPTGPTVMLCAIVHGPNGELEDPTPEEQGDCAEGQTEIKAERSDRNTQRCDYTTLRPTYLPWAKDESEVEAPERGRSGDGRAAILNWFRSDEFPPVYAQLSVATNRIPAKGQPTEIFQQGAEGELDIHAGGDMSISWDNDNSNCNDLRLVLVMPDGTPSSRVRSEIKKIAESLEADN